MKRAILLFLLLTPGPCFSQISKQDSLWMPLKFFIGHWIGTSEGQPGIGKYERSYQFVLNKKFIEVKNKIYGKDQQEHTDFLFNLETITSFNCMEELVKVAKSQNGVQGVVFGRVDFSGSLGLPRSAIDSESITHYVIAAAAACKANGLPCPSIAELINNGKGDVDARSTDS